MVRVPFAPLFAFAALHFATAAWSGTPDTARVALFTNTALHFSADSSGRFAQRGDSVSDRGRVVSRGAALPAAGAHVRILADLVLRPVPKSDREVCDRWDRAGNVRLAVPGLPDLEVTRFMTSYGGETHHRVDVSRLAPLLRGEVTARAFVDTWLSPAWRLDFSLSYVPDTLCDNPSWAAPVFYAESFNAQDQPRGAGAELVVPPGLSRVVLVVTSTGHCTDGTDEDEFVSKANVISVDGRVVARLHPWRTDCRRFRDRNPYCARWTDGSWSSDYSRSGWCPGETVDPVELDLTDALTPGRHAVRFEVEGMRPKDANGHFGYWRISAYAAGWDHAPRLWRN